MKMEIKVDQVFLMYMLNTNDDKTSDIVSDFHDLFIPILEKAC